MKEKDKYEKMKKNVRNVNEKQENMRLTSVNSRGWKSKWMMGDGWFRQVVILTGQKIGQLKMFFHYV